jgi:16S rRNA (guanine(527)-N(7))-methyltransferase RsmG
MPRLRAETPLRALLLSGLEELGSPRELAGPLAELAQLVARWAERTNLTGHRTPEAIARRLVLDAIALAEVLPARPPTSLVDLGSGAGFPGLPIALRWPACRVTLVEPRERRHHFQRAAVRALQIGNAVPVRGRAEGLEPVPHQIVTAQALARPERAAAWMLPWAEPGGWITLARAHGARPFSAPHGLGRPHAVRYQVPLGGPERELWVAPVRGGGRPRRACDTH